MLEAKWAKCIRMPDFATEISKNFPGENGSGEEMTAKKVITFRGDD